MAIESIKMTPEEAYKMYRDNNAAVYQKMMSEVTICGAGPVTKTSAVKDPEAFATQIVYRQLEDSPNIRMHSVISDASVIRQSPSISYSPLVMDMRIVTHDDFTTYVLDYQSTSFSFTPKIEYIPVLFTGGLLDGEKISLPSECLGLTAVVEYQPWNYKLVYCSDAKDNAVQVFLRVRKEFVTSEYALFSIKREIVALPFACPRFNKAFLKMHFRLEGECLFHPGVFEAITKGASPMDRNELLT